MVMIDFSIASQEVNGLFADLSDLNYLFLRLQLIYHVNLVERKSVIIFDEVQMQPLARQAIKHLVKDGRYDYIETGSLLSIKKNIKDIVIPSEETRLQLYPLDYEEFRLYMLVGEMPQAVDAYISTNNLSMVDQVKRNILELYEDDFRKIDPSGRAGMLFDAIPAELNKNASRYQVSSVIAGEKEERVREILADMQDSMTVYISYHADDPSAGLALHKDPGRYKLFLCDTGLFVTLAFKDRDFTENEIYERLLSDKLSANLGYLYENMVAQMLRAAGNELFYYTFPKETSNHNYEIDFLLARGNKICPLEVKSSGYKTYASLDAFRDKFANRILRRYLIYTKDVRKDKDVFCIPIYMVQFQ